MDIEVIMGRVVMGWREAIVWRAWLSTTAVRRLSGCGHVVQDGLSNALL